MHIAYYFVYICIEFKRFEQMYTLKIIVELPDKFKPANIKQVYRNIVNSDTLEFQYNDLIRTFKLLYGAESIISFSII